jgi:hypothetical protein
MKTLTLDRRITMDNELHPVRFTKRQIEFIQNMMDHNWDYFEEECADLNRTIEQAEKGGITSPNLPHGG